MTDEPLVDLATIRARGRAAPRGRAPHPARRLRTARCAPVPEGRDPPAHRRVQAPRRLRGRRVASRTSSTRGVITYSSGNHAQGVARAARLLGRPGGRGHAVGCPDDQARPRRGRRRRDRHGRDRASDERQRGRRDGSPPSAASPIIPPYDDDRIIAGQGTVGLEIVEDLPDVATILVPIGGGGLASGVATAVEGAATRRSASSASSPNSPRTPASRWSAGEIVRWPAEDVSRTIADGTRTQALGRADVRAPAGLPRRRRDRDRGRDRRRRPPGGRASRLVVEPSGALVDRRDGVPRRRARARRVGAGPTVGGRERRQRGSGRLSTLPGDAAPGDRRGRRAPRASRSARRSSRTRIAARSAAARRSLRAASRSSARIQPNRMRHHRADEDRVADDPHDPGRQLLVLERVGRHGTDQRGVVRVEDGRRAEDTTARNVFWVICMNTCVSRPGWPIRDGAGSSATAGHQNSSAPSGTGGAPGRGSAGPPGPRRTAARSGLTHMTEANRIHATTGCDSTRTTREWRTGRIQRERVSCELTRRSSVIGAARASSGAETR